MQLVLMSSAALEATQSSLFSLSTIVSFLLGGWYLARSTSERFVEISRVRSALYLRVWPSLDRL